MSRGGILGFVSSFGIADFLFFLNYWIKDLRRDFEVII